MLRDAHRDGQFGGQTPRTRVAARCARLDHGAVTDLAPGARLLAVLVKVHALERQHARARRDASDEVDHGAVAERAGAAQWQPEDRTQVILELGSLGPLDGPVAGVVYARRHLVGDQPPAAHEELDGEHATIAKVAEHAPQVARRQALPALGTEGRAGQPQDPRVVHVAAQRVDRHLTARAAGADHGYLAVERYPFLVEQRRGPELRDCPRRVAARPDQHLTL